MADRSSSDHANRLRGGRRRPYNTKVGPTIVLKHQKLVSALAGVRQCYRGRRGSRPRPDDVSTRGPINLYREGLPIVSCKSHAPARRQGGSRRQSYGKPGGRIVARKDVAVVAERRRVAGSGWIEPTTRPGRRLEAHTEPSVAGRRYDPPVAAVRLDPQVLVIAGAKRDCRDEFAA